MIIGHSDNIPTFLPKLFQDTIAQLRSYNFDDITEDKINIKGDDLFYMFVQYETKSKEIAEPENHRNYFDIQFIYSGREGFGYQLDDKGLTTSIAYNEERDIMFYQPENSYDVATFTDKMFIIVAPGEVHTPGLTLGNQPSPIKKIVAKIHKDYLQQTLKL